MCSEDTSAGLAYDTGEQSDCNTEAMIRNSGAEICNTGITSGDSGKIICKSGSSTCDSVGSGVYSREPATHSNSGSNNNLDGTDDTVCNRIRVSDTNKDLSSCSSRYVGGSPVQQFLHMTKLRSHTSDEDMRHHRHNSSH